MSDDGIAGVLLAAGAGVRMGAPKQLLQHAGQSLVRQAALELLGSRCDSCFVVVGAHAQAVAAELEDLQVEPISNPDWQEGIGSSIRCSVERLVERGGFGGVLLCLADQPFVTRSHLDALIELFGRGASPVVASRYEGAFGVPALFGKGRFGALCELRGDRGAKALIANMGEEVATVGFEGAARDIDTPEDYRDLLGRTS